MFVCEKGWLVVFNVPSTARSFRDGVRERECFTVKIKMYSIYILFQL